jgi:D-alanyl-D-alanine carboxypeptidase
VAISPGVSGPRPQARPRLVVLALLLLLAGFQLVVSVGQPLPSTSGGPGGQAADGASPVPSTAASQLPGASGSAAPVGSFGPAPSGSPQPTTPPGHPSPPMLAVLDAHLESVRALYGIPGVSATILFRDGTRWTGAAGLADVGAVIPVRPGTPFAIASISKTFTAALILQLVAEGRLALADSAAARLAGTAGAGIDRRITIAQLPDHPSGLRDFFLNPKIEPAFAADPDARWSAAQALSYVLPPIAQPATRFFYSNTNYLLLGLIAEKIGGRPLGTLLRERYFGPLGLVTTSFQALERPYLPLARPYRFEGPSPTEAPTLLPGGTDAVPFRAAVTASGGAGSIAASSTDIATWARALYGGTLLGPTMTAVMVADAARATAVDPRLPYGFGVSTLPIDGHESLGHSGRYLGARGVVRHFPLNGLTIAVLTNQSRTDPGLVLVDLLRLALFAQGDTASSGPVPTQGPPTGEGEGLTVSPPEE